MPANNSRRGRPKGSGLDDSGHLAAIAALIDKNPDLKPTTAIKTLGISDPSTIRRLRDKYKHFTSRPTDTTPKLSPQPKCAGVVRDKMLTPPVSPQQGPMMRSARQPRTPKPLETMSDNLGDPASWFNSIYGLGLQAAATTFQIQTAAMRHLIMAPTVASICRHQAVINELTLFLYKNQKPLLMRVS